MGDFKVCRICLINKSKFYRVDEFRLKNFYEELLGLRIPNENDRLPHYFCYECAALLYKFHRFRQKCYDGNNVLLDLLRNGPITSNRLSELNAKKLHKCHLGHLDISAVNKRVRFCTTKHLDSIKMEKFTKLKEEFGVVFDHSDITSFEDVYFEHRDPETDPIPEGPSTNLLNVKTYKKKVINKKSPILFKMTTDCNGENETTIEEKDKGSTPTPEVMIAKKITLKEKDSVKNCKFYDSNRFQRAFLNLGINWNISRFTEEEALKNFEAKAQDKKYLNAPYKCTDCYRGFSELLYLERHIPQRHSKTIGNEECRFCKLRFKSKKHLNMHMKQHYTKYECLRCDKVCSLGTRAALHEEYHNGVVRKCPHCDKEFKRISTFYAHLRTHGSKHCAICGESFMSEHGLRVHSKLKHRHCDTDLPLIDLDGNMFCEICQMKFETKDAFYKHLTHSLMQQNQEVGNVKKKHEEYESDVKDESKTEEPTKRRSRRAARKTILAKKPTICYHCGEQFQSQRAYMKHHLAMHPRTSFHSPNERVICEVCGASLAPGSVAAHLNRHTRTKMYTCETCDRSFPTRYNLQIHFVTHTGEKRFACNVCDKRFTQPGSVGVHYRTVHLGQPYPKRNRSMKIDRSSVGVFTRQEE